MFNARALVYRSRGPPAASGYTFSAFTSVKDKRLRGLWLVSSSSSSFLFLLRASAQLRSRPTCGSDPHPASFVRLEKVLETHSFPRDPVSSSQAVVSSLQAYLLRPAAARI